MKRIISILLLSMLISLSKMPIYAENLQFTDVNNSDYYAQAVSELDAKNILSGYPDGTFGADKSITRAEMATVICRMIQKENEVLSMKNQQLFTDVNIEHWANGYITLASNEGIINGDGNGLFRPEDNVKYEEAIKMVICALDLEDEVEHNSLDWSYGYIKIADAKGILANMKGSKNYDAKRSDIAVLIYNAILLNQPEVASSLPDKIYSHPEYQNEEIIIDNSPKMHALCRIFMDGQLRAKLGYTNYNDDLAMFTFPDGLTSTSDKISYLQSASYILNQDITLDLSIICHPENNDENKSKFAGLGLGNFSNSFRGFFNGNNKTITLKSSQGINLEDTNQYITYNIGIFNRLFNATVFDINIIVEDDIQITSCYNNYSFGILAGEIYDTDIYNINLDVINGARIGIVQNEISDRKSVFGGLIGTANHHTQSQKGNNIKNCKVNLKQNSEIINMKTPDSNNTMHTGGIVGMSVGTSDKRNVFENCAVNLYDSKITVVSCKDSSYVGGIAGNSHFSTFIKNEVNVTNGSIGADINGDTEIIVYSNNQQDYTKLTVGGILGFSHPGSNNKESLGTEGNTLIDCSFRAKGSSPGHQVLYAKEKGGTSANTGGLVGISFNNCTINNCSVDIENGTIISERTSVLKDIDAQYGCTAGGIIGRLEHTGRISNCIVNGNNLNIVVRSTEKDIYAGGIVGIDIGPAHKKQISLENNRFTGNNSSKVTLDIIGSEKESKGIYLGGIAGQGAYRIEDCEVSGLKLILNGENITSASKVYVGKLIGFMYDDSWKRSAKFEPDKSGIFNTRSNDIIIENNLDASIQINIDSFN